MKKRIAAVTMAFNEQLKLPRWIKHYSAQVGGMSNLFILDHSSDDGSTESLYGVNVKRIPRGVGGGHTQVWRADLVSEFCSDLTHEYEHVIYIDTDELVVADPERFLSLYEYVSTAQVRGTALGFDVIQDLNSEPALTSDQYILEQRSRVQFVAAMCKPCLISRPTKWVAGFHSSSNSPQFGDLFLFHLRYADHFEGIQRLNVTRSISRPDMTGVATDHQKISDETYSSWIKHWSRLPVLESTLDLRDRIIDSYVKGLEYQASSGVHKLDYSFRSDRLFKVPRRFKYSA